MRSIAAPRFTHCNVRMGMEFSSDSGEFPALNPNSNIRMGDRTAGNDNRVGSGSGRRERQLGQLCQSKAKKRANLKRNGKTWCCYIMNSTVLLWFLPLDMRIILSATSFNKIWLLPFRICIYKHKVSDFYFRSLHEFHLHIA